MNNLKITISLDEFINLSYWRHHKFQAIISEERFNEIKDQPGFDDYIHFSSFLSEVGNKTLYRIERKDDLPKSSPEKDKEKEHEIYQHNVAKQKIKIIEEWKIKTLTRLMKTGKCSKEQGLLLIQKACNPLTERDKSIAEKLNYPYREDCIVVSEEKQNELDPNVKMSETSLTYGKTK